jgi:hypothetical protein
MQTNVSLREFPYDSIFETSSRFYDAILEKITLIRKFSSNPGPMKNKRKERERERERKEKKMKERSPFWFSLLGTLDHDQLALLLLDPWRDRTSWWGAHGRAKSLNSCLGIER